MARVTKVVKSVVLVVALVILVAGGSVYFLGVPFLPGRQDEGTAAGTSRDAAKRTEPAIAVAQPTPVGTKVCAECHASEHASYQETAHSRSFGEVNIAEEPEPGGFFHEASGRRYEVRREGEKILHREWLDADQTTESKHVVRFLVGSGRHTRTYLIEDAGFLAESPITWYHSRRAWGISPGYDKVNQGFERGADIGCLFCHTGRVETVQGSDTRLVIHEHAIGCERCHGPGETHVKKHREGGRSGITTTAARDLSKSPRDESIVHPGRLSRALAEAICADCHLTGEAMVLARGKRVVDFRPGSPVTSHRVDFHLSTTSNSGMKVVGHVEQMRLSRCYQETTTLTCTTCHDPHGSPSSDDRLAYYRQKCLECHAVTSCGLAEVDPRRRESQDNCVPCHMPTSKTDIPHVAFTHHRIDVHKKEEKNAIEQMALGTLVPYDDLSQWPEPEQERFLGMGYFEILGQTTWEPGATVYRQRARELLTRCRERGEADGETLAALAKLEWEAASPEAFETAQEALAATNLFWFGKQTALLVLGKEYLRLEQPRLAIEPLQQLVKLRRHSDDWTLLGISRAKTGDLPGAVTAIRRAVEIQPFRAEVRRVLAEILRHSGDEAGAAREAEVADAMPQFR